MSGAAFNPDVPPVPLGAEGTTLGIVQGAPKFTTGTTNITADTVPTVPTQWNDEFTGAVLDPKWSLLNQGTSPTPTLANGSCVLLSTNGATDHPFVIAQSLAGISGTYTFQAKVALSHGTASDSRVGMYIGLGSAASKALAFAVYSITPAFFQTNYTNLNTFSSSPFNVAIAATLNSGGPWYYQQINFDGTNINFSISATGVAGTFVLLGSQTPAAFLGAPPTAIGLFQDQATGTSYPGAIDWFRRVA